MNSSNNRSHSIRIPAVWLHKAIGNNNISHRLAPATDWHGELESANNGYSVYKNGQSRKLIIATETAAVPQEADHLLIISGDPSAISPGREINGIWQRHPMLRNWQPEEVIGTWVKNVQAGAHKDSHDDPGFDIAETLLRSLLADCGERLLVIVPEADAIAPMAEQFSQISCAEHSTNGVQSPIVGMLREDFESLVELVSFAEDCNVLVTTVEQMLAWRSGEQRSFTRLFTHAFIDGVNQLEPENWSAFRVLWGDNRVLRFRSKD